MRITFPQRRFTLSWQAHHLGLVWADQRWVLGFVRAVFISELPYPSSPGRTLQGSELKVYRVCAFVFGRFWTASPVFLAPANHLDHDDSFSLRSCLLGGCLGFSSWTVPALFGNRSKPEGKCKGKEESISLECCLLRSFQFDSPDFHFLSPQPSEAPAARDYLSILCCCC